MNALALNGINFLFSKPSDHGEKEHKRHELALEKTQRARDNWDKRLEFIYKRLCEKYEVKSYINDADEAMFEHYQLFAKQIKPLLPEPQLPDIYHTLEGQKMMNYYLS